MDDNTNYNNIGDNTNNANIAGNNMDMGGNAAPQQPPQQPEYIPPKKMDVLGIVVAVIATIIILGLAGFYYYAMTTTPAPAEVPVNAPVAENTTVPTVPETPATNVIAFAIPATLPAQTKPGYCWVNSIAAPYRQDAWRCMVGNEISDPCFVAASGDSAFCQADPTASGSAFLITPFTKPLPQPSLPTETKDNWAWYLQLQDGTFCSPYTGTLPLINGQPAYYNCASANSIPVPTITDALVPFGHIATFSPRAIDTVVLYSSFNTTGDAYNFNQVLNTYKASNVSPHYFIDRQGRIYRVVADKDIAYHAGKGKMPDGRIGINSFSIGIVMIYKDTEGPNDEQYLALNGLLQILEGEYNIKNIVTHSQISTAGKTDPWNFDMAKLVAPEQVVILGELKKGMVWTATKAILTKTGGSWALKTSQEMNIETLWQ